MQYNGPAVADAPPGPELIGIFGPDAEELATSLAAAIAACGGRYSLTGVSSNVHWGKASNELVKLIYDEHALAVITVGRDASHLAEQLALKAFLPVIAISADRSLTSANIPWIFRLPPKTAVANALRLVIDAAEQSGANRQRLREILISRPIYAGKAQFDSTGEMRAR